MRNTKLKGAHFTKGWIINKLYIFFIHCQKKELLMQISHHEPSKMMNKKKENH